MTRRRAFTLTEILMVIALVGILAGWAISRVNLPGYRVDANVRMLQNLLIGAQQSAITRNMDVHVTFDAASDRVRVLMDSISDGNVASTETATFRALDGAQFMTPETTIDGAAVFYVTGSGLLPDRPALQQAIRFAPNGSVSGDVVIYLGSAAGRPADLRAIAITGATARTAFWSYATGRWVRRMN